MSCKIPTFFDRFDLSGHQLFLTEQGNGVLLSDRLYYQSSDQRRYQRKHRSNQYSRHSPFSDQARAIEFCMCLPRLIQFNLQITMAAPLIVRAGCAPGWLTSKELRDARHPA